MSVEVSVKDMRRLKNRVGDLEAENLDLLMQISILVDYVPNLKHGEMLAKIREARSNEKENSK